MSSIGRSLFGGSEQSSTSKPKIIPRLPAISASIGTSGGSFLTATPDIREIRNPKGPGTISQLRGVETNIGLSPLIAELRDESLAGRRALIGDVQSDIGTLRSLENPFIQARVQPLIEERERARRDAIRRGVSGPLTALATNPFQRAIAEEGARATFDVQQSIRQNQDLIRGLLSDVSGEGRQVLEQELRLLGLSANEIQTIIASQLTQPTAQRTDAEGASQSPVFGKVDPGQFIGGISNLCWVAREVYGGQDPKWLRFRLWMIAKSPMWFVDLYARHGERFASWLRNKPRAKRTVRFCMDQVLKYG